MKIKISIPHIYVHIAHSKIDNRLKISLSNLNHTTSPQNKKNSRLNLVMTLKLVSKNLRTCQNIVPSLNLCLSLQTKHIYTIFIRNTTNNAKAKFRKVFY